jgi:hypothetical protein
VKINFTKKQFKQLTKMLELADHILSITEPDDKHVELLDYVYKHAKSFGLDDLFEYDDEEDFYMPSESFENELKTIEKMEEYNNHFFWETLINRLAERDYTRENKLDTDAPQNFEEFFKGMVG